MKIKILIGAIILGTFIFFIGKDAALADIEASCTANHGFSGRYKSYFRCDMLEPYHTEVTF